jgi:hypothetical protein
MMHRANKPPLSVDFWITYVSIFSVLHSIRVLSRDIYDEFEEISYVFTNICLEEEVISFFRTYLPIATCATPILVPPIQHTSADSTT